MLKKISTTIRFIIGVGIIVSVLMNFSACKKEKKSYVIGASLAVTGPGSGIYAPVKESLDIYFDDVNARGGINGHPVKIIVENNASQPSKAAAIAKKFMTQDKVILTILASLSSTYAPVIKASKQYKVPLLFGGAVCPNTVYPPNADSLLFCSTSFGAKYDSSFVIPFIKKKAKGDLKLGFHAMNIPISRGEIDYAEKLAIKAGIKVVGKQASPPRTADYTPFATKIKNAGANWVYSWAPWGAQIRTFEALRKIGWKGSYIAYGHIQAEGELKRLKDDKFYVFSTNAFFSGDTSMHKKIKAVAEKAKGTYPYTQLTEGWIVAMILEEVLKNTSWPPTPEKVRAAMNSLNLDTKGLKGGPIVWKSGNHFRTESRYRVYRWDNSKGKTTVVKDWETIKVE